MSKKLKEEFVRFLDENVGKLIKKDEYIFKYRDRFVIDTKHAFQRAIERNNLTEDELVTLYKNMIDAFLAKGESYTERDGEYLFFSKSLQQGLVIGYEIDKKAPKGHTLRDFITITFLPRGRSNPKAGTEKIIVESTMFGETNMSQDFVDYINSISKDFAKSRIKNGQNTFIIEDIFDEEIEMEMYWEEGKAWDLVEKYELIEIK